MANWQPIAKVSDIPEGEMQAQEVDGKAICIAQVEGTFYAFDEICTHAHYSLADGFLEGKEVECPAHGARFDITSGEACCLPATEGVCTYPVKQDGDDLYVDLSGNQSKVASGTA